MKILLIIYAIILAIRFVLKKYYENMCKDPIYRIRYNSDFCTEGVAGAIINIITIIFTVVIIIGLIIKFL